MASWTNKFGDDYAEHSAVFAQDADVEHIEMMGVPVREVLMPAFEEALKDMGGKPLREAKILEIGCGTGSILDVLRAEGADPDLLYGVDLNEKSVRIANAKHEFHVQHVEGYDYILPGNPEIDIAFCKQCLSHVPPADYEKFFGKIRQLEAKYFIISEGINPNGYEATKWGEWTFHTNDFLKLCTAQFGKPLFTKNFVAKEPEMFAPLIHDTTALFKLCKM